MKNKRKTILIFILILTVLAIIIGLFVYRVFHNKQNKQSGNTQTSGNPPATQEDVSAQSQNNSNQTSNAGTSNQPTQPKQPILTKSSGNNGPIPVGVTVNFVCSSEPNTTCQIKLTEQNSKVILLSEQQVKDNGRNEYFTQWYWTSIQGSWNIIAIAKNSQGGTNTSEKQTLVVK